MFPISDINPSKSRPIVTYSIVAINIAVFVYEIVLSARGDVLEFIVEFALTPVHVVQGAALYTLVTSMFLHSGFMHVFSNMLYLYIFGDNVEDIMGRKRFILFYLLCGLAASAAQLAVHPLSNVPNLGASGAVAGVLGAYLIMFPRARVHCILIFGFFIRWITLPAVVVLGFWFVIQFFSGVASLPYVTQDAGGVAYFAHMGGFVAGMVLIKMFARPA
ncbi:MAG: rhomboid family intramembrane serine protease [Candidatus Hydrothermarchaeaceae archaeon]